MPELDALRQTIETAAGGQRPAPITLGAAGPHGLVAWIESPDDMATLLVAAQGRIVSERFLAQTDTTDFGYEGSHTDGRPVPHRSPGSPVCTPGPRRKRPSSWQPSPVRMPVYWYRYLVSMKREQ